ncbi:hypothetical protein JMN32_25175 [Fulvivirga sp. 29W222]|uniref:Uncharacterized protein n=1 Tax=Fulvivirga marina TaxID=2494733 RepID=A0A937KGX6_9BACT|nr:hypothetical protein [Fulvivirga marina]MBL6449628.1 hypothetical protein [Fulvivirga marina]
MTKDKIVLIVVIIFISACSKTAEYRTILDDTILFIKIASDKDTVVNGDIYEADIFLTKDTLYKVAQNNKIKDYIKAKYEVNIDRSKLIRASKNLKVVNDTARLKFKAYREGLKPDSTIEAYLQAEISVNFKNNDDRSDTTFVTFRRYYIKGK